MNLATLPLADVIGLLVGFFLTVMVLSYLIGDNPLFRIAINLFIGAAAGYALVTVWYSVLWPHLLRPLIAGTQSERLFALLPLVGAGLLLFKVSPRLSWLGAPAAAYLVGVGAATAVGGAVLGTIFPQAAATINGLAWGAGGQGGAMAWLAAVQGGLILLGTVSTLAYFNFGAHPDLGGAPRRAPWLRVVALVGRIFIAVTLGAIFAGIYLAAFAALIERLGFLRDLLLSFISPG